MKISLVTSISLLLYSILMGQFIISIFACIFVYYALKELGYTK